MILWVSLNGILHLVSHETSVRSSLRLLNETLSLIKWYATRDKRPKLTNVNESKYVMFDWMICLQLTGMSGIHLSSNPQVMLRLVLKGSGHHRPSNHHIPCKSIALLTLRILGPKYDWKILVVQLSTDRGRPPLPSPGNVKAGSQGAWLSQGWDYPGFVWPSKTLGLCDSFLNKMQLRMGAL